MTQEEAKKRAEVMISYAQGCKIQYYDTMSKRWEDIDGEVVFAHSVSYRVKPKPKYRPFKTKEECWEEMQKHQPFGWVKHKINSGMFYIVRLLEDQAWTSGGIYTFKDCLEDFTFADGTPLGIKDDNND